MNVSKIKKYGLESIIKSMKEEGKSASAIAKYIRETYGDMYPELKNFSRMAVARYLESLRREEIEEAMKNGKSEEELLEEIYKEFRRKMQSLIYKMEARDQLLDELIEEAAKSGETQDLLEYLREQRANIEQMRKNLVSLVQYAERQIKPVIQISYKQEINVKNLLLAFSKELCPECRSRVARKVLEELHE